MTTSSVAAAVPEPSTLGVAGIGTLAVLIVSARRRKAIAAA